MTARRRQLAALAVLLVTAGLVAAAGCGGSPAPPAERSVADRAPAGRETGARPPAPAREAASVSAGGAEGQPADRGPAAAPAEVSRALAEAVAAGRPPVPPEGAGAARVVLSIARPARLAGVGAVLRYDGARVRLGALRQEAGTAGFSCQSNPGLAGQVRFACVGLVGEERGGALVSFPVLEGAEGLLASSVELADVELVDEESAILPAELLAVTVER